MLLSGLGLIAIGAAGLIGVTIGWGQAGFTALDNPLPLILSAAIGAIGLQNVLGGFLLAIIAGNESQFASKQPALDTAA